MEAVLAYLIGLALLLLLSAFFSGSETAIFSLSRAQMQQLRKSGSRSGAAVGALLDHPRRLLITILVGNMFVNVATASILAGLATRLLGNKGVGVAIGVTTFLLLIAGEVTPKTFAVRNAAAFAQLAARPLALFAKLIWPMRIVLRYVTTAILFVLCRGRVPTESVLTRDDLEALVKAGAAAGVVGEHETEIVGNIFEFRDIMAREIMTPRTDMVAIADTATIGDALEIACRTEHSRIPVYSEDEDEIWGVFHVKDLPAWASHDVMGMTVRDFVAWRDGLSESPRFALVHPAFLVPETQHVDALLQDMRERRSHVSILLDEYGGTAGLVTMADVLEQLVGELVEESPQGHLEYFRSGDAIVASGQAKIRDLNDDMALDIPTGRGDTIGGYVVDLLGDLPRLGQTVSDGAINITAKAVTSKRVELVEIRRLRRASADEGER